MPDGNPVPAYVIKTVSGEEFIVDREDYVDFHLLPWYYVSGYAITYTRKGMLSLHRAVMRCIDPDIKVDHINNDRFDCRKSNLRLATHQQNTMNRQKNVGTKCFYKGVTKLSGERSKPYQARIMLNQKSIPLGVYASEEEAARAYDLKAKELFGAFAKLNFPEG